MMPFKTLGNDLVVKQKAVCDITSEQIIRQLEEIFGIKNVKVFKGRLVSDFFTAETHHTVENGKGIAQGAVGFFGNDMQGVLIGFNSFFISHITKMLRNIGNGNPIEIIDLAAR